MELTGSAMRKRWQPVDVVFPFACDMFARNSNLARYTCEYMPISAPKQFAVVASQRTGSTLLIRSLDSSPHIFCAGELFHAGPGIHHAEFQFPYRMMGSRKLSWLVNAYLRPGRTEMHLRHFFHRASSGVQAVGFKLMTSHAAAYPNIMPFLRSLGTSFFYLSREDTYATALSYYKARQSGVYHSNRAATASRAIEVVADPDEFDALVNTCIADKKQLISLLEQFGGRMGTYEDMIRDWDGFVAAFGSDIGLPRLRVERNLSKVDLARAPVCVLNEEELRQRFLDRTR